MESWPKWLLSNWSKLLNWKGPEKAQILHNIKRFLKIIVLVYNYGLFTLFTVKFGDLIVVVQMIYWKIHPVSCTNTHHDATGLVHHGMVKNTKIWTSWKRNGTFLRNKKILNLCLRWNILKSYRFVEEVTFQ